MKGRYRAKHYRNTEHTKLRMLLSVILCLCLLTSVLQLRMITASAAIKIDSVTVTHEGKKTEKLTLVSKTKITDTVNIGEADLKELFSMTPYFYRTSEENKKRLDGVGDTALTVDFVILEYKKQ